MKFKMENDNVNHPSHYADGKIEVIDFIEDKKLGFNLGNTVKYISRAGKKNPDKYVEDLQKAAWYLNREIENNTKINLNKMIEEKNNPISDSADWKFKRADAVTVKEHDKLELKNKNGVIHDYFLDNIKGKVYTVFFENGSGVFMENQLTKIK